jgi:type II secretory pathway predicted ATPase ExeA
MTASFEESLGLRINSQELFLSSRGYLSAIPKDFAPKSVMIGQLAINPNIKAKQLLECMKDSTALYYSGGLEADNYVGIHEAPEKGYFHVDIGKGRVFIYFYAKDLNAKDYAKELLGKFSGFKTNNTIRGGVWAYFSYMMANGDVNKFNEFLKCPTWNSINKNYPTGIKEKLDVLVREKRPWENGRLVILSGPAGTGKTFFIRSLMMAWRNKFNFCIVTDPERLASDPAYYYDIGSRRRGYDDEDYEPSPVARALARKNKKIERSLLILEDSADLILTESRQKHYDKIGKLLNMTDGLLGQSREDIFLITFNEDVKDIDAAFLRPGRCLLNAEFREFEEAEATEWLADHKKTDFAVSDKMSLAQLYAALYAKQEGKDIPAEARLGFHA